MDPKAGEEPVSIAWAGIKHQGPGNRQNGASRPIKILILGGGFGGVWAARKLEQLFPHNSGVAITLVSRDNFFLMTPLLFEAMSGTLELRHCSVPIRDYLRHTQFVEASVTDIDLQTRTVSANALNGEEYSLHYDQLILAMGARTNMNLIPGSEHAFAFKTLLDAVMARNHLIEQFERADVETDAARKQQLLTFAVIGGGLVGLEVFGELTAFVDEILRYYPNVRREDLRFELFQHGERIVPEVSAELAEYATRVLMKRPGLRIRTNSPVQRIEPGRVCLKDLDVPAGTIILAAGVVPSPTVAALPVAKAKQGQITVKNTLQSQEHPEVWAVGDCAWIPSPDGGHYPYLAQHAIRAARRLALNIQAALNGLQPQPFIYDTIGVMGSLGAFKGFGTVLGIRLKGFLAWWMRRSYYLMLMPGWSRRIRIVIDWTLSLFFRPDIVKVSLTPEAAKLVQSMSGAAEQGVRKSTEGQMVETNHSRQ